MPYPTDGFLSPAQAEQAKAAFAKTRRTFLNRPVLLYRSTGGQGVLKNTPEAQDVTVHVFIKPMPTPALREAFGGVVDEPRLRILLNPDELREMGLLTAEGLPDIDVANAFFEVDGQRWYVQEITPAGFMSDTPNTGAGYEVFAAVCGKTQGPTPYMGGPQDIP